MAERLTAYNQKRNFDKTLEPEGQVAGKRTRLKFVVQHHMARRDHYDFRLEWEGVLFSWAVPKGPSYNIRDKRLAVQVEEHPLAYGNFEGTIPKGEYGGGTVMLWDEGEWEPQGDVNQGLREGAIKFTLHGRRLKGKWALVRLKPKTGDAKSNWLLIKERDGYTKDGDGISDFDTSIRTGRTMAEIEKGERDKNAKNPFDRTDAQLAKLVDAVPVGDDWLYELKYDGYRIFAYAEGNRVRLVTRNGNDYASRFQSVADSLVDWAAGRAMVLDGEMVIADAGGRTDFQALQDYMGNPEGKNLTYVIFDLLALNGEDYRMLPLIQRKEVLEALMKDAPANLFYSRHVRGSGVDSFRAACHSNLEGIIGKKADSIYSGTRNGDWIKLKCGKRQEFVVGGYTLSDKRASGVSSLLLGVYAGEELVYAGRAGTGFSEADRKALAARFEAVRRKEPPFKSAPEPRANEKISWLEPLLVAEIEFAEWTDENRLRQARFRGLRADKDPKTVRREGAEAQCPAVAGETEEPMQIARDVLVIEGVKITNPDKVLFEDPKITKEDVARYYEEVSARMLPYVSRRVLSIVRCPRGINQSCFYKKHPGPDSKGIVVLPIPNSDGEVEDYFYIEDAPGLISEAQMGTLEFHIWGSRVDALEKPDMMVFDLDPDEGMDLEQVRRGARDIKATLDELSLRSYLKTSGGKGYHVVVPLKPAASWDAFHDFARRVAEVLENKFPDRYTSNVRKANRTNKIFIDWIRNGRGATSIAPYSLRARKGARVSMPIAWAELDMVAPDGVTMEGALKRMDGVDPWEGFFKSDQQLR